MKPPTYDDYLGDGVYASFDGYHIVLDLRGQDTTTRIALEPSVMRALAAYEKRLQNMPPGEFRQEQLDEPRI